MHRMDEISIIAEFNKGNIATFALVYRQLYPAIYRFTNKMIENEAESQDIASESFLKLWNKRGGLQSIDNIKAFLYQVARNHCIDHLRSSRSKTKSHKELLYLSNESEIIANNHVINAEIINEINLEIKNLPTKCGKVFELMFIHGKNSKEVAEEMGITKKTALNHKLKAVTLIRSALIRKKVFSPAMLTILFAIFYCW
jgi:RNA polymerase sigma-70 factor (family 1)